MSETLSKSRVISGTKQTEIAVSMKGEIGEMVEYTIEEKDGGRTIVVSSQVKPQMRFVTLKTWIGATFAFLLVMYFIVTVGPALIG